ncbi:Prefoldin beta-like protein [Schizosaccharomyces pombe]|uniref:Probable prefoldin subunit 2 n=1 Tax=Schizosaccharomyces pombe (strain 972 / ATCC 24843) TaxID=284812 RepID=PFD2_SCHPO|nr:putative prefoldin subunit 2 [Schizosaccharomyces pombe]Q9UTC9.1 RecName: Full=Probable prefoldin subunit 2 [Schizosaccharomyces pombe 972h-]CAB61459.1 prefoldin subunit 2 (predicted) [Schizosaccharomyces pombe]|eukprot:NP_592964.1 putative prefoldin subunit 2 [Schizosaccharomyces pombe]
MAEQPSRQQILQTQYNSYKSRLQQIAQKIVDLETDADEHKLVMDTLNSMDNNRRCFRMIHGVLVERTVGTVVPILKTTQEGIQTAMNGLLDQYKQLEAEFQKFQKDNKIQVVRQ